MAQLIPPPVLVPEHVEEPISGLGSRACRGIRLLKIYHRLHNAIAVIFHHVEGFRYIFKIETMGNHS